MNIYNQPNLPPFLFLNEHITISGSRLSMPLSQELYEWIYDVHWKHDPNLPASIQLETMTQLAAIFIFKSKNPKHVYVREYTKCIFYKKIAIKNDCMVSADNIKNNRGLYSFDSKIFSSSDHTIFSRSSFVLINPTELVSKPE